MSNSKESYGSVPTVEAVKLVSVTVPSAMKEGAEFQATYDGVEFPVTVPPGGVEEGQTIQVPFTGTSGKWKDDLFACTRYGIFHPSFVLSCCCPLILLGQVLTRLKLNWKAEEGTSAAEWTKTFTYAVRATIIFFLIDMFFTPTIDVDEDGMITSSGDNPINSLSKFIYTVYMVYILFRVRKLVRESNKIPEKHCTECSGCEDFLCAFCCGCCTLSQLARQTTDYDDEEAAYFTENGIKTPTSTPVVIV